MLLHGLHVVKLGYLEQGVSLLSLKVACSRADAADAWPGNFAERHAVPSGKAVATNSSKATCRHIRMTRWPAPDDLWL